ncbi:unnamed protein product [Peniophora sp. CBMAI 1063]|nr:unnamed protein product [Peniophora sp. CBMAI 1063]
MAAANLPQDILYAVFKALADLDPVGSASPYGWIRQTTHVCRAWRTAALEQAELWAEIVCAFESPSVTDLLLERARTAPLVFQTTLASQYGTLTQHQLNLAVQNIEIVRVLAHSAAYPPLSAVFDGRTLPRLEDLSVAQIQPESTPSLPILHTLSLHFCCFPVRAPQLRFLSLQLGEPRIGRAALTMLGILSQAPLLEELYIADMPHTSRAELAPHPEVHLEHLQVLHISSAFFDDAFWRKLVLPEKLDVDLNVYNEYHEPYERDVDPSEIFAAASRQLSVEGLDSLSIVEDRRREDGDGVHLIVKLWSSSSDLSQSAPAFHLDAKVRLYAEDDPDLERDLEALLVHLNSERISHIDIGGLPNFYEEVPMRRILAPLSGVQAAILNYDAEHLELLLPRIDEEGDGEEAGAGGIFPALRHLTIVDFPYTEKDPGRMARDWAPILSLLQTRHQSECSIRTFTLNRRDTGYADPQAGYTAWSKIEQRYAPWIERARAYTEVVIKSSGAAGDDDNDEETEYDWHIAGPAYRPVPAPDVGLGPHLSLEDSDSDSEWVEDE